MTSPFIKNRIKIEGEKQEAIERAKDRIFVIGIAFILIYTALVVRAFDLTVMQADFNIQATEYISKGKEETLSHRADIVDRNGVLLATSLKTSSLYADAPEIIDPKNTASKLVKLFPELSYGSILQKLQSNRRFVWIRRNLTPKQHYKVLEIGEPGLKFVEEDRRVYPQGNLAAHFVGYGNIDGKGLAGVERSFNKYLSTSNENLRLTLDIRLQHILRREVLKVMEAFSAKAGTAIMMDVNNGEILAAVSLPDFDPHKPGDAKPEQLFNRVTLGVYELGSTFKIFSTAATLEMGKAELSTKLDTTKPLKRGRYTIKDYHPEDRPLTVPEVFIHSSNIGSALMGERVGTLTLRNFYSDLGLLTPLDFEINEIGTPIIPSPWRDINTLTASYGHGIAVSPMQLVSAVSSITNGGFVVHPNLVLDNDNVKKEKPDIRVISSETAHRMRQLLRLVVTDGTGKNADVKGYDVGGKTGTAEKPGKHGYDKKRLISSFIGVFPMENPKYAVFVMVDEPKPNKKSYGYATGGWVAAPAVANIIKSAAPLLGITPKNDENIAKSLKKYININAKEER